MSSLNHSKPLAGDRARRFTARTVLRRIDDETVHELAAVADEPGAATRRLRELQAEWDLDRVIETEAAAVGLAGLVLGTLVRPAFLALPAAVGAGVLLFGSIGLYPLLPVFRRLGVRTAREIQRERYAIKALRGDFHAMGDESLAGSTRPGSLPSDANPAARH